MTDGQSCDKNDHNAKDRKMAMSTFLTIANDWMIESYPSFFLKIEDKILHKVSLFTVIITV